VAGGQKLAASQINDDLGHDRTWNLGEKKEDDERILFYNLLRCIVVPGIWSGRDAHGLLGDGGGDLHITVASGDDAWGAGREREHTGERKRKSRGSSGRTHRWPGTSETRCYVQGPCARDFPGP